MSAIVVQWLVVLALGWAVVLQCAVHRAPEFTEPRSLIAARKLALAGLFVAAVYLAYLCLLGLVAPKPLALALGLSALSHIAFAVHRLFPEVLDDQ
ncbi:MAG: hypothetical protein V4772_03315 [Pseudomonadota bacterium]